MWGEGAGSWARRKGILLGEVEARLKAGETTGGLRNTLMLMWVLALHMIHMSI